MVTSEGVLPDAFNHADYKLELIPNSGPRKFDAKMDMRGTLEIVPREEVEPLELIELVEVKEDKVKEEPEDHPPPLELIPLNEKSNPHLSKWKQLAPSTHHHCLFVGRFLQNLPDNFEIFEKQRATLAFITIGFLHELNFETDCNFEKFDGWSYEQILEYVQLRRQLASLGSKLLIALSPSEHVSDPNLLRDAIGKVANVKLLNSLNVHQLFAQLERPEQHKELRHHCGLMVKEEKVLTQLINGDIQIYPERLIILLRLETSIENLGSKLLRSDLFELIEDYMRKIKSVPYFVTQYRLNALQSSKRNLCALLVILLPFITRSFQHWKMAQASPSKKWVCPLWNKAVLDIFFRVQSFLGVILSCEIIPSLQSILNGSGLQCMNFFRRIRLLETIEYFEDCRLPIFVGQRLLQSTDTRWTISPQIISAMIKNFPAEYQVKIVEEALQSNLSPNIIYGAIEQLLRRRATLLSQEFQDKNISTKIDGIVLAFLRRWRNSHNGIRIIMILKRYHRKSETSILANLYLLSRIKRSRAQTGVDLVEEIIEELHGWRLNKFNYSKSSKSDTIKNTARISSHTNNIWKRGSFSRNPCSYPLIVDVIIKSKNFPITLYSCLTEGDIKKFTVDLINYTLKKGVPQELLFQMLLQISKPHRKDPYEHGLTSSSYIYDHIFKLIKANFGDA